MPIFDTIYPIAIVISIISLYALLYLYAPYYYVLLFTLTVIGISTILITIGTNNPLWHIYIWITYIIVCNIIASFYVNFDYQNTVTIWVSSLGIYILSRYLADYTALIGNPNKNNISIFNFIKTYGLLFTFISLLFVALVFILNAMGVYAIWGILAFLTASIGYLSSNYTFISQITSTRIFQLSIILIVFIVVVYRHIKIYTNKSNNIFFPDKVSLAEYQVVLDKSQMDNIRKSPYQYSIQFDIMLIPHLATNMYTNLINIDNIVVQYDYNDGSILIKVIQDGDNIYKQVYMHYRAPLQTWIKYTFNIIDGKMDIFINNELKESINIVLQNNTITNALTIGDTYNHTHNGYIARIIIGNDIYMPYPNV